MKILNLLNIKPNFISTGRFLTALSVAFFAGNINCNAQAPAVPKHYICYTTPPLDIDGKLKEKSWKQAAWTDLFLDIEGLRMPLPYQKTKAKMLWDQEYLYIGTEIEEEHIWAYQDKKDQIVYLENDFEVFIDPDGDTHNYYELEINAINNSFDLFLPKPYRNGGKPKLDWDINGLKSAVTIRGTLNKNTDKDKKWTLEIAIPFASLSLQDVAPVTPQDSAIWRINFSRVNWQTEYIDGKYVRKKNPETGKNIPEYNWVWSPQGVINMHVPEKWGFLQFSKLPVAKGKVDFILPQAEKMKILAREVYEMQLQHRRKYKRYAADTTQLFADGKPVSFDDRLLNIQISDEKQLVTVCNEQDNLKVTVDQEGKIFVSSISTPVK